MPLSRLLTLIIGVIFILGMTLLLVDSIFQLYAEIAFTAPLLANLLLLLIIILLAVIIGAFAYYFHLSTSGGTKKTTQRRQAAKIPAQKNEAASYNLQAVRQQVDQIQDEVAREALLRRSQEIEANLARGEIRVIVFGTGSAGKTSLVNALIGRMVGEVGAPMGTTQAGETYCLQLPGLAREIYITDTPGILEAGIAGTEREQLARELATQADLLLFVVDNDLRASEYEPLRNLAQIGKRSLLVLNKVDLYSPEDEAVIVAKLRERVRSFIAPSDIVTVCANPQPVPLETGEIVQPEAEIFALLKRLAAVLRAEGEDLIADNILLQSQRLSEEARKLIDKQRRRQAEKIIDRYQWLVAGAIAVTPLPGIDLLAAAAVNAQMVVEIGKVYDLQLDLESGRELALSLGKTLVSLGVVKGAVQLLSTALQLNIATYLVGKAIQGVTGAYLTRIAGKSFIEYFRQGQDWGDGGITEVVQRQFKLARKDEFVKSFVNQAIAQVVKPLTDNFEQLEQPQEPEETVELEVEKVIIDDWETPTPRQDDW
ncbi:MAG: GTP-binding protein [Oscillatoria sp. PMC 1068.18]|nr:GTP-binding protein [Oscillatoria sp. PMC 1076.18]MEC4989910.1 GTP-binding protein [Oscillatoria sp. PMC 1068.18]